MERIIKRGDIFYATLNPVIGSEQDGTRPVLTISNNTGNRYSPTIIIAPITSHTHTKAKLPTHTEVKDFDKLDKDSIILLEQIRTIDKQRLKQYMENCLRLILFLKDGWKTLERKINFISVTITKQLSVRRYLKKHRRYLQKEMLIVVYIRKVRSGTNLAGNMLLAV